MSLLESIMVELNGAHGPAVFAGLRQAFLICLALAVAGLLLAPRPGRKQLWLLATGLWLALLAVLVHQAAWQLAGFRRPEFVRFMRFHDPRPDTLLKQVRRGAITDWRGTVLARSDPVDIGRRIYPLGSAACHAVGYFDPRYGMAGVEQAADATLCGYSFASLDDLDRFGRNLLDHRAAGGSDVALTLDAELQVEAYGLMAGKRGAVVVLRPSDGAILCLASAPGFDPANPAEAMLDTVNAPLLNRAVQGLYPPGSTFKILMAGLAAERRLAPQFHCPAEGFVPAPGCRPIRDSEFYSALRTGRAWAGYGRIGLQQGFIHSSNVYFSQLGEALGATAFDELVVRSRINTCLTYCSGAATSLASAPGHLPQVGSHDRLLLAQLSIGQGPMLLTPLHVASLTAAVASDGMLRQPRLRVDSPAVELGRVMTPEAAATVRDLMRDAVRHGTGRVANVPGLTVCGKTGTAEAPGGGEHAWFTCFAPARRPELVVTVLVERGGYGAQAAAPIACALLEEAVELGLLGSDIKEQERAE